MGERGPKPKFTDVACPNESCRSHLVVGQGNIVGNGTYQVENKRIRRYLCRSCGRAFCDRTNTFFYNLRTDEDTIELALKMSIKGMSTQAIADVLEVQAVTVNNWLARSAEQCEKVNEAKMKNLYLPKIEMDELWVIIQKK
jgi:transposase-like protein